MNRGAFVYDEERGAPVAAVTVMVSGACIWVRYFALTWPPQHHRKVPGGGRATNLPNAGAVGAPGYVTVSSHQNRDSALSVIRLEFRQVIGGAAGAAQGGIR